MLGTEDVAAMEDGTRQGVGVLFISGRDQRVGAVKTTEEDTRDDEVAATIDWVEDGSEGCAAVGVSEDVVAGHFQLALDVAGRHQSSRDAGSVIGENMLGTTMGVSR